MKHKVSMSLLAASMLTGGFQIHAQVNNASHASQSAEARQFLNIEDLKKIVPYMAEPYRDPRSQAARESFLVNKDTKERIDIVLTKGALRDYVSPWTSPQYYNDRMIMSGTPIGEHGPEKGRSLMLVKDNEGRVEVQEYDFEIVFYDETEHKYVVRADDDDRDNIFYVLNENMEQEMVIGKPAGSENADVLTNVYNLNTIVYTGKIGDKQFQVQKYDIATNTWHNIAELLSQDVYEGYEGIAEMSYNEANPEWATFRIGMLWQPKMIGDYMKIEIGDETIMSDIDYGMIMKGEGADEVTIDFDDIKEKVREVQSMEEGTEALESGLEDFLMVTMDEEMEAEMQRYFEEQLANGQLKQIDALFFVNLKTGEVRTGDLGDLSQGTLVSMPGMKTSILYNEDKLAIVEMNPADVRIVKEIPMTALLPGGRDYINTIVQHTDEDIIFWTLNGLVKHTFATGQSEYLSEIDN